MTVWIRRSERGALEATASPEVRGDTSIGSTKAADPGCILIGMRLVARVVGLVASAVASIWLFISFSLLGGAFFALFTVFASFSCSTQRHYRSPLEWLVRDDSTDAGLDPVR